MLPSRGSCSAADRLGAERRSAGHQGIYRVDTDLAAAAELDAALVLSGGTERQALNGFEPPPSRSGTRCATGNDPDWVSCQA